MRERTRASHVLLHMQNDDQAVDETKFSSPYHVIVLKVADQSYMVMIG